MPEINKKERLSEEFELENDAEAVKEYDYITSFISANYSLIADELSKIGGFNQGEAIDIGSGLGDLAIEIAKRYPNLKITGLDISQEAVDEATKKASKENLSNLSFNVVDVHSLPFKDNSFDLVVSHGVMHHLKDLSKVLSEVYRVLKPGAIAYLSDLRRDAPIDTVKEVEKNLPPSQAKGFINSVQASYTPQELEKILRELKVNNFSITDQVFSKKTIIKNRDKLRKSPMMGSSFSKLSQILIIRK